MWFDIAARLGMDEGATRRDSVAQRLRPEQVESAQRMATEWMEKELSKTTTEAKEADASNPLRALAQDDGDILDD